MKMKKKVIISMLAVSATLALGAFMGGCSLSDKIEQWRCDHENITENVVIDPTCYEKGELKKTCDDCGKTWTEDIEKVAHTWNDGEVVVEATCTETGITRYTCTVEGCEAVEDRVTDKVEHTRVEMPAVAPTCTTVGYTEWYKCGDCGLVLTKKQELPALGHVEMELQAVAPTCTETGLTAGVGCVTCGEVFTAQTVVPATGHNIVTVAGKPATCTETGLTDGQACEDCGKVYFEQTEIPATGHIDSDDDFICDDCSSWVTPDTSSWTEVPVVAGELVTGNWYRMYRGGEEPNILMTTQGLAFGASTNEAYKDYYFTPELHDCHYSGTFGYLEGLLAIFTDAYIDIYLAEGEYDAYLYDEEIGSWIKFGISVLDNNDFLSTDSDFSNLFRLEVPGADRSEEDDTQDDTQAVSLVEVVEGESILNNTYRIDSVDFFSFSRNGVSYTFYYCNDMLVEQNSGAEVPFEYVKGDGYCDITFVEGSYGETPVVVDSECLIDGVTDGVYRVVKSDV